MVVDSILPSYHRPPPLYNAKNGPLLSIFAAILDEPVLLVLIVLLNGIAWVGMAMLSAPLKHRYPHHPLPDLRVAGYTVDELNIFYAAIGPEGCQLYVAVANWDLFPFTVSYALLLGTALVWTARQNGWSATVEHVAARVAAATAMADLVETYVQRRGCSSVTYDHDPPPQPLSPTLIRMASACLQIKWILISLSVATIITGNLPRILIHYSRRRRRLIMLQNNNKRRKQPWWMLI